MYIIDLFRKNSRLFLYIGLSLLTVSFIIRGIGVPYAVWVSTFSIAIFLKAAFLVNMFQTKGFKMSLGLLLIVIGIIMILLSLIFKHAYPLEWLKNILFYGAITLKVSGLVLMLLQKKGYIRVRG